MQALESLRAAVSGARAAVSGAVGGGAGGILHSLPILGHLMAADDSRHEVPHLPETGFVGADAICAAAGKRVEDYLGKRSTKARAHATRAPTRCDHRCVRKSRPLRTATAASMPCEVLAAVASLSRPARAAAARATTPRAQRMLHDARALPCSPRRRAALTLLPPRRTFARW